MKVEVQYNASATGGSRLYLNGLTQPTWGVTGQLCENHEPRSASSSGTTPSARPTSTTPAFRRGLRRARRFPARQPASRAHRATGRGPELDGRRLRTAEAPISGYRITPYIGANAQTPTITDYPVTSYTVTGLTNGTTYTFRVAAINGVGTGADSAASACDHAGCATVPGAPTGVTAVPGDSMVTVGWTPPCSTTAALRSRATASRPFIGSNAQTPITVSGADDDELRRDRSDERNDVHLPRRGDQCRRDWPELGCLAGGDAAGWRSPQYTNLVFADGFETGKFSNWTGGTQGTGTASVQTVAAHSGAYGARITTLETPVRVLLQGARLAAPGQPDDVLGPDRRRLTGRD